jgi:hypothetical protein
MYSLPRFKSSPLGIYFSRIQSVTIYSNPLNFVITYFDGAPDKELCFTNVPILPQWLFDEHLLFDQFSLNDFREKGEELEKDESFAKVMHKFSNTNFPKYTNSQLQIGKYYVKKCTSNEILLQPTQQFSGKLPIRVIALEDGRLLDIALAKQQLDLCTYLPKSVFKSISNKPQYTANYSFYALSSYSYSALVWNVNSGNKGHVFLRKALFHALPIEKLNSLFNYPDVYDLPIFGSLLNKSSFGLSNEDSVEFYFSKYLQLNNIDKDAGEGVTLKILCKSPLKKEDKSYLDFLANRCKAQQINLIVQQCNEVDYYQLRNEGKYDLIFAQVALSIEERSPYYYWHSSSFGNNGYFYSGYKSKSVDSLTLLYNKTQSTNTKHDISLKIAQHISKDIPVIFLKRGGVLGAAHHRFHNKQVYFTVPYANLSEWRAIKF